MDIVSKWLKTEFDSDKTRTTYKSGINKFVTIIGGIKKSRRRKKDQETQRQIRKEERRINNWLEDYLSHDPNFVDDIKLFITTLRNLETPFKTINTYVASIKLFLEDHGYTIHEKEWKKIKKRLLPPSIEWTVDKAPTREELLRILKYLGIKGRSMVFFLMSTGCRIDETLKLEIDDIDLDSDPPMAHMRTFHSKYGISRRTIPFSYQARDSIKGWLDIRDGLKKKTGGSFSGPRIWNISYATVYDLWNRALDKAGLNTKDRTTGRKEIHINSLRKWFNSNATLHPNLIRAIMGQRMYLDRSYLRTDIDRVKREYLAAMDSVSIYSGKAAPSAMEQLKQMAKQLGVTQEQIDEGISDQFFKQEVKVEEGVIETQEGGMDITELAEVLFPDIYEETLRALITKKKDPNNQMVIDQSKLENHLNHGWTFVSSLENNKCIVKQNE